MGFGLSFFLFRICFHAYYLVQIYLNDYPSNFEGSMNDAVYQITAPKVCYTLSMLLHIMWFNAWITKYLPALLGTKKKEKKM
jgi:hypothetical protein